MKTTIIALTLLALLTFSATPASAHCDTMEGPVVKAAAAALEKGNIDPVLKWIKKENESEIREAFRLALDVRLLNSSAKSLADQYFFETVVRVHRQGEGEPYTGLKPAGTPVDPVIAAADDALKTGNVENLSHHITAEIAETIESRFAHAVHAQKEADASVDAGRRYVAAYVEFVHYLEQLDRKPEGHKVHEAHE